MASHDYPSESWRERTCTGGWFFWSFEWEAWTLRTDDKQERTRRIYMWTTLVTRTMLSVFGILTRFVIPLPFFGVNVASFLVHTILAVLGFFFVAWCLTRIGEATGARRVLGVDFGRSHLDSFLMGCALVHIALLAIVILFQSRWAFHMIWYGMWLLITGVAWITTWTAEQAIFV